MSEPPTCCICLDEFTRPASLPCGHRFCLGCVGEHWRMGGAYRCPVCRASFPTRPPLRASPPPHAVAAAAADDEAPRPGEVACDVCPAPRRAVKSCLGCVASFCAAHLEPHYRSEELGRHRLIGVAKNLEGPVCGLHGRRLDGFCGSDQTCVCATCARTEHRGHRVTSIGREAGKKKDKLKRRVADLQRLIRDRLSDVERLRLASDDDGDGADVIGRLRDEIRELRRRNAELERLSQTEDDLRFLQRFPSAPSR